MDTNIKNMNIGYYPWLINSYQEIISYYFNNIKKYHALLIYSHPGNGDTLLCYNISIWLMCKQLNNNKNCNTCLNCKLMKIGNHPNFYQTEIEKDSISLRTDNIFSIIENLYFQTKKNEIKVIWLPNSEFLKNEEINLLVKTLDNPPENTYFLLGCHKLMCLSPIIKKQCLFYFLQNPNEVISQNWLKKSGYNNLLSISIALKICNGAPIEAKILLKSNFWQQRTILCNLIQSALIDKNFLKLLPELVKDKDDKISHWLQTLITDTLKWKQGIHQNLINEDKIQLINTLAENFTSSILLKKWFFLNKCIHQWTRTNNINKELLLIKYLLYWK